MRTGPLRIFIVGTASVIFLALALAPRPGYGNNPTETGSESSETVAVSTDTATTPAQKKQMEDLKKDLEDLKKKRGCCGF